MTWTSDWLLCWALVWLGMAWLTPRNLQPNLLLAVAVAFLLWVDWRGGIALGTFAGLCHLLLRLPRSPGTAAALIVGLSIASLIITRDVLPDGFVLGLAFAAVRCIHVAIDRMSGATSLPGFLPFLRYLFLFPGIIAGPVHRLPDFQRDEARRRWDPERFSIGLERALYGLVKIVVLAGWVHYKILHLDTGSWSPAATAWFQCLTYGWNLYWQFSGYCDVAIGLALAAGYRMPENFSYPFLATNLADFWRRWHASLSQWCRDYVASPVMALTRNRWLAIVAAMVVLGCWHEFSLRYLAWGIYHGCGIVVSNWFINRFPPPEAGHPLRFPRALGGFVLTQGFVIIGFAFTSSPDLPSAFSCIRRMFGLGID